MHIWNFSTARLAGILPKEVMFRPRIIFSHDGRFVWFNQADGSIGVARTGATNLLCRIRWSTAGNWTVIAPDGQFDADNVDEITGLHWVFPDEPLHALPPEVFMREYFHHGLLADLLQNPVYYSRGLHPGEVTNSAPVRPLQSLNRALPAVTSITVSSLKSPDLVHVEMTVAPGVFVGEETAKTNSSGAYDLQLFEDGQLVGEYPEPNDRTPNGITTTEIARWRRETLVDRERVVFPSLKLHHRHAGQAVEFSAYAFNEDRIRGPIAKTSILAPTNSISKTAYVVSVGVNDYGTFARHLQFAVADAQAMARDLTAAFQAANYAPKSEVLVSDYTTNGATKARISSTLASVAIRSTADDAVVIFFAGHGFCAKTGEFYMLPSVSGFSGQSDWENPSSETLSNCISTAELSIWLRSIVAEHFVLILDACQSAAAVGSGRFRPAPLGDRGLGQLAYDKGMFVLAACESDQQAQEIGGQIGGGALTHVLLHGGLDGTSGSTQGHSFTLRRWLKTPVHALPSRFGLQQPVLIDCERKRAAVEDLVLRRD
jgi:hypothetical protein